MIMTVPSNWEMQIVRKIEYWSIAELELSSEPFLRTQCKRVKRVDMYSSERQFVLLQQYLDRCIGMIKKSG